MDRLLGAWRQPLVLAVLVAAVGGFIGPGSVPAVETAPLANGMTLEGNFGTIGEIGPAALTPVGAGGIKLKRIVLCDDELRRTFVFKDNIAGPFAPPKFERFERFQIPQRVCRAGRGFAAIVPIRWTPFDEHGRRIMTINTNEGPIDVVQGITEVTPTYTKLEVLQGQNNNNFVWAMSIATSSISRSVLSKILYNYIDVKNADQRIQIVRLYIQSERIQDARAELDTVINDFPGLAALGGVAKSLTQSAADRLIKEIELRRDAGQPLLAIAMLQKFPSEGVAGETLIKVRDLLGEFNELVLQGKQITDGLDQHLAAVKDERLREELAPIVAEIKTDLNIHNVARLADYLRLSSDAALSPENKLSLAISGWLLGKDSGLDNLVVSKSLVEVRELVRQYLRSKRNDERVAILGQLSSLEGATPEYVAKLVAHMRPPLEPAPPVVEAGDPGDVKADIGPSKRAAAADENESKCGDDPKEKEEDEKKDDLSRLLIAPKPGGGAKSEPVPPPAAKDEAAPAAAAASEPVAGATDTPGLYQLTVAGLPEDPRIEYWVQLPPEYSPYRRYPCIVTLNGTATPPLQQIDWWAGDYNADARTRYGQATRHGYIVIAPRWLREHQRDYEYSAREHAAALYTLRDASRRFSIDSDRVFLSGHSLGGDAAWDIGLAHPDLWAGVLPIVATADKHVLRYWENAKYVPLYFVSGEKDGDKLERNAQEWNRYLGQRGFDAMVVQFQGRGHEHFHEESQNLFKWMNLHKRNFFPRELDVTSMRPWDSFFWWIDLAGMPEHLTILPTEWPKKDVRSAKIEGRVLDTGTGVRVTTPASKTTVWLAPEMVNFSGKVTVWINARRLLNVTPSVAVLLEDVRTRGDRLHPFWAKAESP